MLDDNKRFLRLLREFMGLTRHEMSIFIDVSSYSITCYESWNKYNISNLPLDKFLELIIKFDGQIEKYRIIFENKTGGTFIYSIKDLIVEIKEIKKRARERGRK